MYPIQQSYYPNQAQCVNPYMQPQVNAVKIDINNPQAYGGVNDKGQVNPALPSPYACPCCQFYAMPQVSQYNTPGAYPIPPMMQQQSVVPMATTVPTPVQQTQVAPQVITNNNQTVQNPIVQQAPVAQQPQAAQPTVPVVPVVPAPVFVPPTPVVSAPVTQNVNVNPSIPAAVVDSKQNTTVAPVQPVQAQTQQTAGVDVNGILNALTSANADDQTAAIQKVAEIAQTNPVAAKALLNEQVFGQLVNIINADTSKLQGPADGKPDPKNLSPLEKAEINKQFAVYTLAILQKNFREEINKEMKKNNLPDIAINDIPYIKEGIVNNLKDNPNPTIREACLSALNYMGKPEDKEVLKTLYEISAKHDVSPAVKAAASDYLAKIPA